MSALTATEAAEFINALQLSIATEIAGLAQMGTNKFAITFTTPPKDDERLAQFKEMVGGVWDKKHTTLTCDALSKDTLNTLRNFIYLTRLNKANMSALARMNSEYAPFVKKISLPNQNQNHEIASEKEASKLIFAEVAKRKITLRELAQKSGLTVLTLSKFKAGNDIRFSNLLKITKVLGLTISLISEASPQQNPK